MFEFETCLQVMIYTNVICAYMCFPFFVCAIAIDVGDPMEKVLFCIFLIHVFFIRVTIYLNDKLYHIMTLK
jgi:hypothetical protein